MRESCRQVAGLAQIGAEMSLLRALSCFETRIARNNILNSIFNLYGCPVVNCAGADAKLTNRTKSIKIATEKGTVMKKPVKKKLAKKKVTPKKKPTKKKVALTKAAVKSKLKSKASAPVAKKNTKKRTKTPASRSVRQIQGKSQSVNTRAFEASATGARSGGQSGDLEGLSNIAGADSESVEELIEEGNAFEAEAVQGVEDALDPDEGEVHTHEQPEDDVPDEYGGEQ
jgi:hypothetical protein